MSSLIPIKSPKAISREDDSSTSPTVNENSAFQNRIDNVFNNLTTTEISTEGLISESSVKVNTIKRKPTIPLLEFSIDTNPRVPDDLRIPSIENDDDSPNNRDDFQDRSLLNDFSALYDVHNNKSHLIPPSASNQNFPLISDNNFLYPKFAYKPKKKVQENSENEDSWRFGKTVSGTNEKVDHDLQRKIENAFDSKNYATKTVNRNVAVVAVPISGCPEADQDAGGKKGLVFVRKVNNSLPKNEKNSSSTNAKSSSSGNVNSTARSTAEKNYMRTIASRAIIRSASDNTTDFDDVDSMVDEKNCARFSKPYWLLRIFLCILVIAATVSGVVLFISQRKNKSGSANEPNGEKLLRSVQEPSGSEDSEDSEETGISKTTVILLSTILPVLAIAGISVGIGFACCGGEDASTPEGDGNGNEFLGANPSGTNSPTAPSRIELANRLRSAKESQRKPPPEIAKDQDARDGALNERPPVPMEALVNRILAAANPDTAGVSDATGVTT